MFDDKKVTKQKDFDALLENIEDLYTQEELDELRILYDEMSYNTKQKAELIRPIIPIKQWLNDLYYVGPDGRNIYKFWKDKLIDIFDRPADKKINQIILTGAIGCLKTDTLYATSTGFKTIRQLSKQVEPFSVLSETSVEDSIATKAHILGVKPTKKITLYNGTVLEGTYNHKIKVLENNKIVWKRFDNLTTDDIVIKHRKKELFSSKAYDADLAYMIGLLLGDGYITNVRNKSGTSSQLISLCLQDNQSNYNDVLAKFTKYFGKPNISYKGTHAVNLRKQSCGFKNLPFWNAINNKSYTKYIPEYLLEYNEETIAAVIRGLFDTDSGVSVQSANIEFTLANKKLVFQVKRLLEAFGINSRVTKKETNRCLAYRLIINGQADLALFNKYIGFNVKYKQEALHTILSKDNRNQRKVLPGILELMRFNEISNKSPKTREYRHVTNILSVSTKNKNVTERTFKYFKENLYDWLESNETLKYIADNNVYTVIIDSIEDSKSEVGDIEVPTTHCYNLGGIISHNTGKSTFAVLVILRVIYELSCYRHISSLFNLFGVSRIAFAYLSVTRQQAQNTGFALLIEWLDSIPYFREKFQRNSRLDSMAIWPEERLIITFGSVANHFIGMNLFGSILDEANFFSGRTKEDGNYKMNSKVADLYTQIITRSESRFIVNGINYSMSLLVSSSTVESSFTEERMEEAKDDPHTYIISSSLWDVKPQEYSGKTFLVYVGGDNVDPFIIKDLDDINMLLTLKKYAPIDRLSLRDAFEVLPAIIKAKVLKVPVEHKIAFQGNIVIALQNLAGYSVSSANKLFSSNTAYEACLDEEKMHPFSKEEIVVSTTTQMRQPGFLPLKSYLYNDIKFKDPKKPHFIHLDLALTGDSAGIAMCHICGWKSIYKQESNFEQLGDNPNGLIEDEIKIPIIEVDFMLRINPPNKPNKISLSKIRDFIVYLRNTLGINFGLITADQFQSAQLLQELDELGFSVGYQSVDRKPDAYLGFTQLVYEHRVKLYDYKPFRQELFGVVYYPARKKVDHTASGCFVGSQKIFTLSGEDVEIKDLVNKKEFWVLSSETDGSIVPSKGYNARQTKSVNRTVKVTLDNDEIIECTPEHLFMLRDGSYMKAKDLVVGASLMPLYKKERNITYNNGSKAKYIKVKDNKTNRYSWLHRLVIRKLDIALDKGSVVHHYDMNPHNNTPENLKVLSKTGHTKLHAKLAKFGSSKENIDKRCRALKKNNRVGAGVDPNSKKTPKEQMIEARTINYNYVKNSLISLDKLENTIKREIEKDNYPERFDKVGKKLSKYNLSKNDYQKLINNSKDEVMRVYGGGRVAVTRRLESIDYSFNEYNHKVKSIEKLYYEKPIPVYDISVEGTSNFALTAGVVVHNSKDVADAVVGAAHNAVKFNDKTDVNEESLVNLFAEINTSSDQLYKDAVKDTLDALLKGLMGDG